ncbi:hypothetical protein PUN28_005712 [Cardiocondyla obscurior]|uniref:Uncharacterized protein n=1 Tax=Cardiocondyla obscurior TaxID=286306 RepID=A0AAW2GBB1_9HYME
MHIACVEFAAQTRNIVSNLFLFPLKIYEKADAIYLHGVTIKLTLFLLRESKSEREPAKKRILESPYFHSCICTSRYATRFYTPQSVTKRVGSRFLRKTQISVTRVVIKHF